MYDESCPEPLYVGNTHHVTATDVVDEDGTEMTTATGGWVLTSVSWDADEDEEVELATGSLAVTTGNDYEGFILPTAFSSLGVGDRLRLDVTLTDGTRYFEVSQTMEVQRRPLRTCAGAC